MNNYISFSRFKISLVSTVLAFSGLTAAAQDGTTHVSNRAVYQQSANSAATGKKIYGEWIILSAKGRNINMRESVPYLNFNASDGKIYGEIGPNIINAKFELPDKGSVKVTDAETTRQPSSNVREENDIKAGLLDACTYSIEKKKNDIYYLDISDKKGNVVIHAKRHNADVLTGLWHIARLNETDISNDSIEIVVDVPELKLHGKAGCNIFNGEIGLDRNKDWFIQFQNINVSRMKCDEAKMSIERDLLVALEEVEIIKRENGGKSILLLDKNKNELLQLERVTQ